MDRTQLDLLVSLVGLKNNDHLILSQHGHLLLIERFKPTTEPFKENETLTYIK